MLNHFILKYSGNKYNETKKYLLNEIDKFKNVDIIIEPFCGIFGFSRVFIEKNKDFKGEIWLNDINTEMINFFKSLKHNPNKLINDIENELKKYNSYSDFKQARKNKTYPDYFKLFFNDVNFRYGDIQKNLNNSINNFKKKMDLYKHFFDKVKLFNLEFNEFMEIIPKEKTCLIFFDPPYFNSSNRDYVNYSNDNKKISYCDGTTIYLNILSYFENNNDKNKILLMVINKIDIINYLFKQYTYLEYKGIYNGSKNIKHHIIYIKNDT